MSALLEPAPQFPSDFALRAEHDADDDERTFREVWESEQKALRTVDLRELTIASLHARIAELEAQIRDLYDHVDGRVVTQPSSDCGF